MKLKSVVASMLALGLASGVALAATKTTTVKTTTVSLAEFNAVKDQVAQMQAVLNQNHTGGALKNDPSLAQDWFNRVTVSGQVDVDGFWNSNQYLRKEGSHSANGVEVPNANLFIDAQVNDWVKAHISARAGSSVNREALGNFYSAIYEKGLGFDEAYVTVANFAQSPFYFRAGQQYVPFGDYNPQAITPSLTQMLSEANQAAAQAGFVMANGFNGAVYAFNGKNEAGDDKHRTADFGVNLGYAGAYNDVNYKLGVGYINNMADLDYVYNGLKQVTDKVDALSLNGSVKVAAFDVNAHYVTALTGINGKDLKANYLGQVLKNATNIKPSAWDINAGYNFDTAGHDSRIGIGYERSKDATLVGKDTNFATVGLGMPEQRYVAQYDVNLWKNTDLGFQVYHDRDYDKSEGGSDNTATTGVVRLSVKFA